VIGSTFSTLHVTVHELVYLGARARVALLVKLVEKPGQCLLRFALSLRTSRDHVSWVVPLTGDRIGAGVDLHAE
jgi:hypothetical protein